MRRGRRGGGPAGGGPVPLAVGGWWAWAVSILAGVVLGQAFQRQTQHQLGRPLGPVKPALHLLQPLKIAAHGNQNVAQSWTDGSQRAIEAAAGIQHALARCAFAPTMAASIGANGLVADRHARTQPGQLEIRAQPLAGGDKGRSEPPTPPPIAQTRQTLKRRFGMIDQGNRTPIIAPSPRGKQHMLTPKRRDLRRLRRCSRVPAPLAAHRRPPLQKQPGRRARPRPAGRAGHQTGRRESRRHPRRQRFARMHGTPLLIKRKRAGRNKPAQNLLSIRRNNLSHDYPHILCQFGYITLCLFGKPLLNK